MSLKSRKRLYNPEYIKYGFTYSGSKEFPIPICVICEKKFSNNSMKKTHMLRHLMSKHHDRVNENINYFLELQNSFKCKYTGENKEELGHGRSEFNNDYFSEVSSTNDKKISPEIKTLMINAIENGTCNKRTIANVFNVPYYTVLDIYSKFLRRKIIEKKEPFVRQSKFNDEQVKFVYDCLAENCTLPIKNIQELVKNKYDIEVPSVSLLETVRSICHYNFKRNKKVQPTILTPTIMNERQDYCELFLKLTDSRPNMMFFSLTEFEVSMRKERGKSKQSESSTNEISSASSIKTSNKIIMATMTQNELFYYKSFSGPRATFFEHQYFRDLFARLQSRQISGALIIMDKEVSDHCPGLADGVREAGHDLLLLPVHSGFLNPVEKMFSQWDTLVRSRGPRDEAQLKNVMEFFAGVLTEDQCRNYWDHALYNVASCINRKLICIS